MRDIEHYVSSNVDIFCDKLVLKDSQQEGEWGETMNMSSMANYLTFDILAELCFGKGSFGMLVKPDHRHIVDLILHNAYRCMIVSITARRFCSFKHSLSLFKVRYLTHHPQSRT